jgi:hypothetical protein
LLDGKDLKWAFELERGLGQNCPGELHPSRWGNAFVGFVRQVPKGCFGSYVTLYELHAFKVQVGRWGWAKDVALYSLKVFY